MIVGWIGRGTSQTPFTILWGQLLMEHCVWLIENLGEWPFATVLAFSESKMAAKMSATLDKNQNSIITYDISSTDE